MHIRTRGVIISVPPANSFLLKAVQKTLTKSSVMRRLQNYKSNGHQEIKDTGVSRHHRSLAENQDVP